MDTMIPTDDVVAHIQELALLSGVSIADSGKDFIIIPFGSNKDWIPSRQRVFWNNTHNMRAWLKFTPKKMSIRVQSWMENVPSLWKRLWLSDQGIKDESNRWSEVISYTYSMSERRGFRLITSKRGDSIDASTQMHEHSSFASLMEHLIRQVPEIQDFVSLWFTSLGLELGDDLRHSLAKHCLSSQYPYAVMDNLATPTSGQLPSYYVNWTNVSDYTEELFGEYEDKTFRRVTLETLQDSLAPLSVHASRAVSWLEAGYPRELAHFVYENQIDLHTLNILRNEVSPSEIFKELNFSTKRMMRLLEEIAEMEGGWLFPDTMHMIYQSMAFAEEDNQNCGADHLMELNNCRTWDELHDTVDRIRRMQNRKRQADRNKHYLEPYPDKDGKLRMFCGEFEVEDRQYMVLPPVNGMEQIEWSDEMDHCIGSYADAMYRDDPHTIYLGVYDAETCELEYNVEVRREAEQRDVVNPRTGYRQRQYTGRNIFMLGQFRGQSNSPAPQNLIDAWIDYMQESRGVEVDKKPWW